MALFVQLRDKQGVEVWHTVAAYESEEGRASLDIERRYTCGCGLVQSANGSRMAEADVPPWTNRHVAKGCFDSASDPVPSPKQGA